MYFHLSLYGKLVNAHALCVLCRGIGPVVVLSVITVCFHLLTAINTRVLSVLCRGIRRSCCCFEHRCIDCIDYTIYGRWYCFYLLLCGMRLYIIGLYQYYVPLPAPGQSRE